MDRERWKYFVAIVILTGLIVTAYAPGLTIPYYADDFKFFFLGSELHWTDHFFETGSTTGFYRPLQNAGLHLMQSSIGMDPIFVHLAALVMHLAVVTLVYEGGRWLGATRMQSFLAAVLMGIAQANAAAVLGNDTFSQVASTFFGYLSLRCYGAAVKRRGGMGRNAYAGALASLIVCLLLKETGFAFFLLIVLVELYDRYGVHNKNSPRSSVNPVMQIWRLLPVFVLGGGYLIVRSVAGAMSPGFGSDPYQLHFGLNLLRNIGLFGVASVSPISTTSLALWVQTSQWTSAIAALSGSLLFAVVVSYDLNKGKNKEKVTLLLTVCACSLSPVLPLNDISELYVYTAMPPLCVIAGMGLGRLLRGVHSGSKVSVLVLILTLAYVIGQVIGIREKATLMKRTGERTQTVLKQIAHVGKTAPPDATLCLRQVPTDTTSYSVFRMPGVTPFTFAEPVVQYCSGRSDLHFAVGSSKCVSQSGPIIHLQIQKKGWNLVRLNTP